MIVIAGYLSFTNKDTAENTDTLVTVDPDTDEYGELTDVVGLDVVTNTDTGTDVTMTDTTDTDGTDSETTDTTTDDANVETTAEEADNNALADADNTGNTGKNDSSDKDVLETAQNVTDNGELDLEEGVPGEAVLASTSINKGYFISSKLDREQVRAKNKETLMDIIESDGISEEAKKKAIDSMIELTEITEKESATEMLLEAKGFDGAVVYIVGEDVNVVINAETLTDQQLAIIENVVKENTDFSVDHININTVVAAE